MQSFKQVIQQYQPLLSRVVSSYERNEALQQELLQEVTLAIWQALPRFSQQASLKTYVLKVAHNRAVSHVIQQRKHNSALEEDKELDDYHDSQSLTPEQSSSQFQQIHALLEAVHTLPLKPRQVITLSLEGLSYQEIAEVTGMNTNLVGVTLNRAKQHIKRVFHHD